MTVLRPRHLLAAALAVCLSSPAQAVSPPPDPATDPAGAWRHVLDHGDYPAISAAFDVVDAIDYSGDAVDAEGCRSQAAALDKALAVAPVSLALWRMAYLCADATGDTARADRAEAVLASLAAHALAASGDATTQGPMRMLVPLDSSALLATMGVEADYTYYVDAVPQPYLRYAIVVDAADGTGERHLVFDDVDTAARLDRADPNHGTSMLRHAWADGLVKGSAKNGAPADVDLAAVREAMQADSAAERATLLRAAARDGGLNSAMTLLTLCAQKVADDCAPVVDALLERAERNEAMAMSMLAFAQVNGIGTAARPADGWALLDRAHARWTSGALANYIRLHEAALGEAAWPEALRSRFEAAAAAGNPMAQRVLAARRIQTKQPLAERDISLLQRADQNGNGLGYRLLWADATQAGRTEDAQRWLDKAADAGDAFAQGETGMQMLRAGDAARAAPLLREAANAGQHWAARVLASRAARAGNAAEAQRWLLGATMAEDADSVFLLADLYASEPAGIDGKVADAVRIYESLADEPQYGVRARRALAVLAMQGHGVPKDAGRARTLLAKDALGGNAESQVMYASMLLRGQGGPVELVEGERLMQAAIAAKAEEARLEYGNYLYYVRDTPESRARALELWKAAGTEGDEVSINNYAWVRCVSRHADVREGADGLAWARKMGAPSTLSASHLDTLAACHAAVGDFVAAAETQQKAIDTLDIAGRTALLKPTRDGFLARLAGYRNRQAFTEPVRAAED